MAQVTILDSIVIQVTKNPKYDLIQTEKNISCIFSETGKAGTRLHEYRFTLLEEVTPNKCTAVLSVNDFDTFMLDYYYNKMYKENYLNLGRMYFGNFNFKNLFIKLKLDNIEKVYKVDFNYITTSY
ncbi:hypothetical protein [Myroides odoratus]|uniref:hypothetical protein n=1 Tax=Myroides odoratus TaxID=256 RepID=UPI0039B0CA5C